VYDTTHPQKTLLFFLTMVLTIILTFTIVKKKKFLRMTQLIREKKLVSAGRFIINYILQILFDLMMMEFQ